MEVGVGAVAEEAFEVGEHGGLIGLDGEHEVRAAMTQALDEGALGEQGVGGDGFAGEVELEGVEHGDDGADFVGAFGLVAGDEGRAAYFFCVWVIWL